MHALPLPAPSRAAMIPRAARYGWSLFCPSRPILLVAVGLVSLAAMDAGRVWFRRLWRNTVGTVPMRFAAGAFRLAPGRSTFAGTCAPARKRCNRFGLSILPLLTIHGRHAAQFERFGFDDTYTLSC